MSLSFSIPIATRMVGEAGQGIILMGSILAKALVKEGYWVAQSQHYGAQVRGGISYCDTLFDIEPIDYPLADSFDILYLMHGIGSNHIEKLKRNSILFYDEKFVEKLPPYITRITRKIIKVPASKIALEELSNINVANMISLGVLCSVTQLVSEDILIETVRENVATNYRDIDEKAVRIGYSLIEKRYPLKFYEKIERLGRGYE
ncbi:MAG TPA: 2-oxoacid:acceptor oxidoreductase family protein [Defluviitoga sp.]|nr:2-oxoacid:acceptor oxidoreductase family protein [Defluviitoga sp.]HOP24378.1 2-oxoacid:acceptor oxidoreductase family protein [Defluviitoga sp.]HPZ28632.1 2-oxoacid:acceptor oxidoreductase family protein [Defluviitoga sp.]HQD62577.1 2-oxoacid:acceptor oxidoreductase family protein [Defluviitoga sp.]